jgi:single-strand DNA-binding protein
MTNTFQNNVQLTGHLGRNPEVITFEDGKKVVKLLLAINEYKKNTAGDKETHTQWHTLTAWGSVADIAEKYLIKGKQIMVHGKLNNKTYLAKDGSKRYTTEIIVNQLQML